MSLDKIRISGSPDARERFKLLMEESGRRRGLIEGTQRAILVLLEGRGLFASTEQRAQIRGCSSWARLDRWLLRAATATSVTEVLGPAPRRRASKGAPAGRRKTPAPRAA
jgi:hypothetical protein